MSEQYLTILIDNLKKKCDVLDEIIRINVHQKEILEKQPCDFEEFDVCMDDKDICIEQMDELDEEFDNIYQQVQEILEGNKEKFTSQIAQCQSLLAQITDKSAKIQALDADNKKNLEITFRKERKDIGQGKRSAQVAKNYYRNMNHLATVSSQYLDKKK